MNHSKIIDQLKFDEKGLIPAIVQDAENGEVLMFAYMNRESLEKTLDTGVATYWSRSRNKLWIKGETSGHKQEIEEIRFDCDNDCLLLLVNQNVAACHTGYRSCFFNKIVNDTVVSVGKKIFVESEVYKK